MRSFLSYRVVLCGLCAAACLIGCKVERPDTVFADDQMVAILCDYHKAKAMGEELPYDDSYKKVLYMESVFRKHGVTQAEFDSSMVWFARHPDVLSKVYDKVKENLQAERDDINRLIAIRDNRPTESQPGDSVDVWVWKRVYQLTGMPFDNKLTFTFPADVNFKDNDTLVWNVRFNFLETDSLLAPTMAMQMLYANDTLCTEPVKVYANGMQSLKLASDTMGMLHEVRGFVYLPMGKSLRGLLLDSVSLVRYHNTDTLSKDSVQVKPKVKKGDAEKVEASKPELKKVAPQKAETKKIEPRKLSPRKMDQHSDDLLKDAKMESIHLNASERVSQTRPVTKDVR